MKDIRSQVCEALTEQLEAHEVKVHSTVVLNTKASIGLGMTVASQLKKRAPISMPLNTVLEQTAYILEDMEVLA